MRSAWPASASTGLVFVFDLTTVALTFEATGTAIVAPRSMRIEWQSGLADVLAGWRQSRMNCPTKLDGTVSVNTGTLALTSIPVGHLIPTPAT